MSTTTGHLQTITTSKPSLKASIQRHPIIAYFLRMPTRFCGLFVLLAGVRQFSVPR